MLKAKEYLQKPFIFHCCDAIVLDKINLEEIKELKVLRDEAIDEGEIIQIEALIEEKQIEEKIVNEGVKNKEKAVEIFQ